MLSDPKKKKEYDERLYSNADRADYDKETGLKAKYYQGVISVMQQQAKTYKAEALAMLREGTLWFGGGLLGSLVFYLISALFGWESYIAMSGAIFYGMVRAIRGIYHYLRIHIQLKKLEHEIWDAIDK